MGGGGFLDLVDVVSLTVVGSFSNEIKKVKYTRISNLALC